MRPADSLLPSRKALAAPIALLSALLPAPADAAPEDSEPAEIVVTGERSTRRLANTPSSVAVTTAEQLDAMAAPDRLDQVLALVPNVQVGSGGEGPAIRGQDGTGVLRDLPAFLGGTRPRTTLQVDGRALGFNEFVFGTAPLWDVRQIEVFLSPQSTTQGRNSIAGAIFVSTNDPTYDWQGRLRAIGGNYGTKQGSAMLSGPIVTDRIAFRIAGDLRRGRTASRIADFVAGADPNRDDYGLLRVKLLAEPAALPGARLELTYVHTETEMPQIEGVRAPFKQRRDPLPGYGTFRTNVDSWTGLLDYRLAPAFGLTTTVSHGDSVIRRFAPPGLGETATDTKDLSVEAVLRWQPDGPVQIVGGVHHLGQKLDQAIDLSAVIGRGRFTDDQTSLGLFGEITTRLAPRLRLTTGLRYQSDRQDRHGRIGDAARGVAIDYDARFSAWLPKVSLAYDVTRTVTAGLLVQRAYNPGGTTMNFETDTQDEFGAETLWSCELFTRATLAGGRVTIAANLFRNAMRDAQRARFQAFRLPGGATAFWAEIDNVPKARSQGLEVEFGWRPGRRLSVQAGLGLLDTKIVATATRADPLRGKDFRRAPHLTATAALSWQPIEPLRLSAQIRHGSGYFSDDIDTPALRIAGATVVDARAAYAIGRATLFAYAQNLFDDFYLTNLSSAVAGSAGSPRKIGLGIDMRF